jgi:phosphoribosylamine--glycine ligase
MENRLREGGFVGYVNLNTIVNDRGIWPLEFTCRFGYPGFAVLAPLQATPWGELFRAMVTREPLTFLTRPGFSVGLVLTTPPFPYSRHDIAEPVGLPVFIDGEGPGQLHYAEVGSNAEGQLVTSGLYGWTLVATGVQDTIAAARRQAYEAARRVTTPNLRYRLDIGERLIGSDHDWLEQRGFFGT